MSKLDPAALAFHAVALALVAVLCVLLFLKVRSDPPTPAGKGLQGLLDNAKKLIEPQRKQPNKAPPQKAESTKGAPARLALPAGRSWRYNVTLDPPQWRDAVLVYTTAASDNATVVTTEFTHANGRMNFQLGTFAANHPSHANVRFPGFFMYPAYLDKPPEVGQRLAWEWPWQLPGGKVQAGRIKRWEGEVKAWENVQAPIGTNAAARIEATLSYVEDGKVRATAKETLWYAPSFQQLIKVVREGATPDEGAKRIIAELVEFKVQ